MKMNIVKRLKFRPSEESITDEEVLNITQIVIATMQNGRFTFLTDSGQDKIIAEVDREGNLSFPKGFYDKIEVQGIPRNLREVRTISIPRILNIFLTLAHDRLLSYFTPDEIYDNLDDISNEDISPFSRYYEWHDEIHEYIDEDVIEDIWTRVIEMQFPAPNLSI